VTATTYRACRPLTDEEIAAARAAILAAASVPEIFTALLDTVFGPLLESLGERLADYGPGHQLDPGAFAIPAAQWAAIIEACLSRADALGGRMQIAMDLINVMPASYDDPSVTVSHQPTPDQRPCQHVLMVTREATDVIAAASRRCADLASHFGENSPEYRKAARSWEHQLSQLFLMSFGARTTVTRDGDLSLLVSTGCGIVYGIIFHRAPRWCTAVSCKAEISDDGTAWTHLQDDPVCPGGQHTPSYPLDAPIPGTWSFHS
jgi:hypothetical protein